jgi:hypothetical protein
MHNRKPSPIGTPKNNPAIHRWVIARQWHEYRQGRQNACVSTDIFFRPSGAWAFSCRQPTVETVGYGRSSLSGLRNACSSASSAANRDITSRGASNFTGWEQDPTPSDRHWKSLFVPCAGTRGRTRSRRRDCESCIATAGLELRPVPDSELVACCYWEYARESAFIRATLAELRADLWRVFAEDRPTATFPIGSRPAAAPRGAGSACEVCPHSFPAFAAPPPLLGCCSARASLAPAFFPAPTAAVRFPAGPSSAPTAVAPARPSPPPS